MIPIVAAYFVPRGRRPRASRLPAIQRALSRCQRFFAREASLALIWRLHPSPIFGSTRADQYADALQLEREVRAHCGCESETVGIFFEGHLPRPALATMGDSGPQFFVIAEPHLGFLEDDEHDDIVAHEIGHTLGLQDRHEGLSIMRQGRRVASLGQWGLYPWTRAHLAREDRKALRRVWASDDWE